MELEITMLCEINQAQKAKCHSFVEGWHGGDDEKWTWTYLGAD
jgi:hypothetical protein